MKDNNGVYTERLKKLRTDKGITFKDMARLLEYNSPSSYMYIERGDVQPTIEKMNKISNILGESVEYFFKLNVQDAQTNDIKEDELNESSN